LVGLLIGLMLVVVEAFPRCRLDDQIKCFGVVFDEFNSDGSQVLPSVQAAPDEIAVNLEVVVQGDRCGDGVELLEQGLVGVVHNYRQGGEVGCVGDELGFGFYLGFCFGFCLGVCLGFGFGIRFGF
jgi:hypothetical protein